MFSSCDGTSEAVSTRIGSAWKRFGELGGFLVGTQGLSLKQHGKIYQSCVGPVLLYFSETGKRTVAEELRLHAVEGRLIMMMCGVRLAD